jgi:undecaprenyl-diphosphatase
LRQRASGHAGSIVSVALAALLGAVQGLTEFLPISSKTHLVIVPALLGKDSPSLEFIVLLHLGTFVALLIYFARDLLRILSDLRRPGSEGRRIAVLLIVATIPAAVVGVLFEDTFERLLEHPRGVAFALLATAVILAGSEWIAGTVGRERLARPLRAVPSTRDAVGMGIAQAVALLPGVSRSGSTMGTGLALGLSREAAARFAFLMAIPAIAGANVIELPDALSGGIGSVEIAGFVSSLVFGYAAVAVLLRYLRRWNFLPFAVYCAVFAIVAGIVLD